MHGNTTRNGSSLDDLCVETEHMEHWGVYLLNGTKIILNMRPWKVDHWAVQNDTISELQIYNEFDPGDVTTLDKGQCSRLGRTATPSTL